MLGPEVPQNNFQIYVGRSSDKLESEVSKISERFISKRGKGEWMYFCAYVAYTHVHTQFWHDLARV